MKCNAMNINVVFFLFEQIEGVIESTPERPQPPNPTATCPIYRWDLQNKYNYTVSVPML